MKARAKVLFSILFFVIIFLEVAMQSFWIGKFGIYLSPIIYLIFSFLYLFYGVYFSQKHTILSEGIQKHYFNRKLFLSFSVGSILFLVFFISKELIPIFESHIIDAHNSDVIPALQLYVKRLLSGQEVYKPMHFYNWVVYPNYLPFTWLPYVIAELFSFDYRWIPFAFFVLVNMIFLKKLYKKSNPVFFYLNSIIPFIILFLLIKDDMDSFGYTVELTIVSFYLLLTSTILHKSNLVLAIGILICLLSRYSFTFWLPVYLIIIWVEYGFKRTLKIGIYILAGVILFFVIPFMLKNSAVFFDGLKYYKDAALGEWNVQYWQHEGEKPFHLQRGFGFAIYFYDFIKGDLKTKLLVAQKFHLIISFLTAVFIFVIYYLNKKRIKNLRLFLLFSLKFYIMVFYSFIHVPYSYLFVLPLFLIIPIFNELSICQKEFEVA